MKLHIHIGSNAMNSLVSIVCLIFLLAPTAVRPVHAVKKSMLRKSLGKGEVKRLTGRTAARPMTRPCTLYLRAKQLEDRTHEKTWQCELDPADNDGASGFFVDINIDIDDQNDPAVSTFESGVTKLDGDSIYLHGHHAYVHGSPSFQNEGVKKQTRDQRHLQIVEGNKTVLVIRAKVADSETSPSSVELALKVFGVGAGQDDFNLSSGYDECSYGKLKFTPTQESSKTENGVLSVTISNVFVENSGIDEIRDAMIEKAKNDLGVSNLQEIADYTMVCIPPGTEGGWVAYAYVNSWLSVYNDNWCTSPSAQMHEIGHNIGLAHSNEGGQYQDQSGMMGYSYGEDEGPRMCFNNAKNYQLGWYSDKGDVSQPLLQDWTGSLIGIDDYQNQDLDGSEKIILTVQGDSLDYHVGFNRVKGLNADNKEGADDKVLIQSRDPGTSFADSQLVAKLGVGDSYKIEDFGGDNRPVTIEVTSIDSNGSLQKANVSVKLFGCTIDSECDDNNSCTTDVCDDSTGLCTHVNDEWCAEPFLKIAVVTDNYPSETSWSVVDHCDGDKEILSGANYDVENKLYNEGINIAPSRYSFTIKDSYGDGMCCNYGNGSYNVTFGNDIVAVGAEYEYEETKSWGHCDSEGPSQSPTSVNPEKDLQISVTTDRYPGETSWSIIDICDEGKEVMSEGPFQLKNTLFTFDTILAPSRFKIIMRDSWGDGICCKHGNGSYEVRYGGKVVAGGGSFQRSEATEFGEDACPVSPYAPSISPSSTPSKMPSTPPTLIPTTCGHHYNVTVTTSTVYDWYNDSHVAWNILYDEGRTIAAENSTTYEMDQTYTENGCLEKNCYRFNIFTNHYAEVNYTLEIDDIEIASSNIVLGETTLFGTCSFSP